MWRTQKALLALVCQFIYVLSVLRQRFRIPGTNINLAANYQQGRTILRVTCVPDDFAPLLGPNGFQNGVGPGNVGINLRYSRSYCNI